MKYLIILAEDKYLSADPLFISEWVMVVHHH